MSGGIGMKCGVKNIFHKRHRKIMLSAAVISVLLGGAYVAGAETYDQGLTGELSDGEWLKGATVTGDDDFITYDFGGKDNTFNVENEDPTDTETPIGFYYDKGGLIENTGGTLHLNLNNPAYNSFNGVAALAFLGGNKVTINSNLDISVFSDYLSDGFMLMGTNSEVVVNGNVKMRKDDINNPWAITSNNIHGNYGPGGAVASAAPNYTGARWTPTGIWMNAKNGSSLTINGDYDVAVRGTAVMCDPYGRGQKGAYETAIINLHGKNTRIETPVDTKETFYSIGTYGGTVNVNVKNNMADVENKVTILGNIITMGQNDEPFYVKGRTNIGLVNSDSSWTGIIDNAGADKTGQINLWLKNGASWYHKSRSRKNGLQSADMPSPSNQNHYGVYDGVSYVTNFFGGSDEKFAGTIYQQDEADIDIKYYKGVTKLIYSHDNAGDKDSDYKAGNVIIHKAKPLSKMILSTDNKGVDMADRDAVESTLSALAHKLYFKAVDGNLVGTVQIAEGLTASSASKKIGDMDFRKSDGQGFYKIGSVHENDPNPNPPPEPTPPQEEPEEIPDGPGGNENPDPGNENPEIVYGDFETGLMRGVKSVMTGAALSWRDNAAGVIHRIDVLRDRKSDVGDGIWAKVHRGKMRYDRNVSVTDNYQAVEAGVDRYYGNGWLAGIGIDYRTGNAGYAYGGRGKEKVYSLNFYGSKEIGKNAYVDITAKAGRVSNKYTVYNSDGKGLEGDYFNRGYGLSVQSGKRFKKNNSYAEPQVQFTWAHLKGSDYDAVSGKDMLRVNQHDINSLVGRVGVEFGHQSEKSDVYARFSLNHEFGGDIKGDYSAADGGMKSTSHSLKDTWWRLALGGKYEINRNGTMYAELSHDFGSDYKSDWRIDFGARFLLGQGASPAGGVRLKNVSPGGRLLRSGMPQEVRPGSSGMNPGSAPGDGRTEDMSYAEQSAMGTEMQPQQAGQEPDGYEVTYQAPGYVIDGARADGDMPSFIFTPVVVTASRVTQPILDAKADISVVTKEEIEKYHLENAEQVLRTVPGVQFLNYGGNALNGNISGIRINGISDIVVLVDGVRMSDFKGPKNSGYFYPFLMENMDNIERVEVLRGSASTLYGSGAKGGVINIITKKVNSTQSAIHVSKGTFGRDAYRFYTQGVKDKLSYNVYYNKVLCGDFRDGGGVLWTGHTNDRASGTKISYDFSGRHTLTFNYDENNTLYGGWDPVYIGPYLGHYHVRTFTLRDELFLSDRWKNTLTYRRNKEYGQYRKPDGEGSPGIYVKSTPYDATEDYKYTFISDQVNYTSGRHNIVFGLDYSKAEGLSYNSGTTSVKESHSMDNYSWYAQEEWKILPNLTLTGGIRHDKPSMKEAESHTSKSYKLSWDITDKDAIYAGRSDFFILPSMYQLYNAKYGNKSLRPAYGRTSNIGYNRKFSDKNFFTFNWFYTIADSDIGYSGNFSSFVNAKSKSRGWNAQYQTQINDRLSVKLGWAHLNLVTTETFLSHGYQPKDLATFALTYDWNKFSASLNGYYFIRIDSKTNHFYNKKHGEMKSFPSDKYAVMNLNLNYNANKETSFYLKIENLFDTLYAEHTDVSWNAIAGPDRWYSLPGRTIIFGTKLRF